MFNGCSSLNYIKMLATNISAGDCMANWVSGVASTGTFIKDPAATWNAVGTSGVPEGWTSNYDSENEYEYVDLGLSVKWATCNVGATKPEEYGNYYAWGETEPKSTYSWATYKWCGGTWKTMTKYNTSTTYGSMVDNNTVLDLDDDAAHMNWGGNWRMATETEWYELKNYCTWTWTTLNGVNGYLVTSKKAGYTDRSIFLPAGKLNHIGEMGSYYASTLGVSSYSADVGEFSASNISVGIIERYYGKNIRPVCE